MKRNIGIYSGTFDPVHTGHIAFAAEAIQACGLDEVVFLPEGTPRGKQHVTDISHRVALIERAADNTANMRAVRLASEQFTIKQTLPELRDMFKDAQFTFLVGSDVARTLPKWERIEELIKEASFAIGMRAGDGANDIDAIISRLEGTYGVSVKYTCICAPGADIASSQIRNGMLDALELHPTAYEYMQQHGLYTAKDFIQDA